MPSSYITEKLELIGIKLKNYRSCRVFPENDEYSRIGKFTTLIGKNDVGKSNILRAIDIACNNQTLSPKEFHKGTNEDCEIKLLFKVPDVLKDELKSNFEHYAGEDEVEIKVVFSIGERLRRNYYLNNERVPYGNLEKFLPQVLFIPAVVNVEDELKFKRDSIVSKLLLPIIEKTSEERSSEESIPALKKKLLDAIQIEIKDIHNYLRDELSKIWDGIEDVRIVFPELRLDKAFNPEIEIKDKYLENNISITYRGSGIQRHLILALLEIYRKLEIGKSCILLMEEPEIYLHIGAQKKMCSILKDISKEGQVIISTHSNIFVDKSDLSTTYLLIKENGETKLRKFEGDREILDELGISPSDIFLTNGIIFVEGPSDVEIVKIFANAIFENWEEYNIAILPIGGSNIEYHDPATLLKVNPNIAVILDSDIKCESSDLPPKKRELKQKFENLGIPTYFWKKDEKYVRTIENLFTKEAIEQALSIELESEIEPYEDVPTKLSRELFKRRGDYIPDDPKNEELIRELNEKGKLYNKIKHGKKIANKMIELNQIPDSVRDVLENIVKAKFGV